MQRNYIAILLVINLVQGSWFTSKGSKSSRKDRIEDNCFCQLKGKIDDCSCSVETIDSFNNLKIYPRLQSLLHKDYFKYWKVNLNKGCPFWADDSQCTIRYCSVQECDSVPQEIDRDMAYAYIRNKYSQREDSVQVEQDCDKEGDLGYLNTTISEKSKKNFEQWAAHDSAQDDSFCLLDDESSQESRYVNLLLNPERYTGYVGQSAHRVWKSIYQENCFKPSVSPGSAFTEFSSIGDNDGFMEHPEGIWGPNVEEFHRRFDPELTNGAGTNRLKNLYFLYLLELRALAKVAPYMENLLFYTGNEVEDNDTKAAVMDLLAVVRSFPDHFDESAMFNGNHQSLKLKDEFKNHFRNISRIMDCVGCDKCRLWGKLQVTGLGTALNILFSGIFDSAADARKADFTLTRNEIGALFNAFGRLSTSIAELENFRRILQNR